MEERWEFQYSVPRLPKGSVQVSVQEAEQLLLKKLADNPADRNQTLWELVQFYKQLQQHDQALQYLRKLLERLPDAEGRANCILTLGQMAEQTRDYPAAVRYYKEAMALEPMNNFVWYFINNNLGFSLNTLGHFGEGEHYCRKAIEIEPQRPNAYKNLGIALAGQGEYREAARSFIQSTRANASDSRAFGLLKKLLADHPELEAEFGAEAELCRKAVEMAAAANEKARREAQRKTGQDSA